MHDTTWVNLENIMLSEKKPSQYSVIHLYEKTRIGKFIDSEGGLVIA